MPVRQLRRSPYSKGLACHSLWVLFHTILHCAHCYARALGPHTMVDFLNRLSSSCWGQLLGNNSLSAFNIGYEAADARRSHNVVAVVDRVACRSWLFGIAGPANVVAMVVHFAWLWPFRLANPTCALTTRSTGPAGTGLLSRVCPWRRAG